MCVRLNGENLNKEKKDGESLQISYEMLIWRLCFAIYVYCFATTSFLFL